MEKYLLVLLLLTIGSGIYGQPRVKIFGFEQQSSTGAKAANVKDENGNQQRKAAQQKDYFIYLSVKETHHITPEHLYIDGKAFSVETRTMDKTPIEHVDNSIPGRPEQITLVPKTTDEVFELKIAKPLQVEKTSTLQKLTKKNDVVVFYTWKNKKYFAVLKKLKKLDPVLNE